MKYTQDEIFRLKKHIGTFEIPIDFEAISSEGFLLRYKYDKDVYLKFNNLISYSFIGKHSNGQVCSFSNHKFEQILLAVRNWVLRIKTDNPFYQKREPIIEKFSKNFYKVYYEAIMLDSMNFTESAGMIYRKALEILIKDFLINTLPNFTSVILEETIGSIVYFFYDVKNDLKVRESRKLKGENYNFNAIGDELNQILPLLNFVNNTFKIGSDFSHYERRLNQYSTKDLEKNLNQIIDYLVTKYEIIENQKKINVIGENFKNHTL